MGTTKTVSSTTAFNIDTNLNNNFILLWIFNFPFKSIVKVICDLFPNLVGVWTSESGQKWRSFNESFNGFCSYNEINFCPKNHQDKLIFIVETKIHTEIISKYLLLCFTEERKSYSFKTTWGKVFFVGNYRFEVDKHFCTEYKIKYF